MRKISETEYHEAQAHPARFLEIAVERSPEQQSIEFETNEEAVYFFKRLSASNSKTKRFRPLNIHCTRYKLTVYAKAPKL